MSFDHVVQTVRRATRGIGREPGFAFAVIATVALTMGANTALFSVLHAIVLRPLPVLQPERLVVLQAFDAKGQQSRPIYYSSYRALKERRLFASIGLYSGGGLLLIESGGILGEAGIEATTPGFYESLGLRPFLGRFFDETDAPSDGTPAAVVVISYDLWRTRYGRDPAAVGETLRVRGEPLTIIGVMPPAYRGFHIDTGVGFAVPLAVLNKVLSTTPGRPMSGQQVIARLQDGISLDHARASLTAVWSSLAVETAPPGLSEAERTGLSSQRISVDSVATGFSTLRKQYSKPLVALVAMTALLLVIGCINLSGLQLARTAAKAPQLATQIALGATRRQVVQQVITDSVVLSIAGGVAALPLAWWATRALSNALWHDVAPLSLSVTPDTTVLALTFVVAVAAGLVMSGLPAWAVTRNDTAFALRLGRGSSRSGGRYARALLVGQVALSLMLLFCAGLFSASLARLRGADLGFAPEHVRFVRIFAVPGGYRQQDDVPYYRELVRRLSESPNVEAVSLAHFFPSYYGFTGAIHRLPVAPLTGEGQAGKVDANVEYVMPAFFRTLRIPLLRGRDFGWGDDASAPPAVVINEAAARSLFGDGDPLGRSVRVGEGADAVSVQVIGVVRDATVGELSTPRQPIVFRPKLQQASRFMKAPVVLFRASGAPAIADREVKDAVASLGHEYVRGPIATVAEQVDVALTQERMLAWLSGCFAGLAALLVVVGLYGLLAFTVTSRTHELGIRVALGASPPAVLGMVIREGVKLVGLGVAVGVPAALLAGQWIRSLLHGVGPSNYWALLAASGVFLAIGVVAGVRPGRRASAVDPVEALRAE